MTLAQMQARFFELKGKLAVGQITEQEFKHALEQLRFQDPHGRWWMIGAQSGRWYYYDGARWLLGDPPDPGAPGLDAGMTTPVIPPTTQQPAYSANPASASRAPAPQTISVPYSYAAPQAAAAQPAAQPAPPARPATGNGNRPRYVAPAPFSRTTETEAAPHGETTTAPATSNAAPQPVAQAVPQAAPAQPKQTLRENLSQVHLPHVQMPHVQMPHVQRPNLHAPNIQVPPQIVAHTPAPLKKYQPPFVLLGAAVVGIVLCALVFFVADNIIPNKPVSAFLATTLGQNNVRSTPIRSAPQIVPGQNVDSVLQVADDLATKSQYEPALKAYQDAAKLAPNKSEVYWHWARALALTGRIGEAITQALKATKLDPTSANAFAELARAYAWAGQNSDAISAGQKAVELDSENATAQAFLAEAYLRAGRNADAQATVDKALELDDLNPETHRVAGWVAILSNRKDEGVGEWNRVIELAPNVFLYHYEFGLVYANHLKDFEMAIPSFQKAIELYPPYIPSYVALGRAYLAANQPGPAILQFQKALTLDPKSSDAFVGLGQAFQAQQKCPQAIPYFQKALELDAKLALASKGLEDCGALTKGSVPAVAPTQAAIVPLATAIPQATVAPAANNSTSPKPTPAANPSGTGTVNSGAGRIYFPVYDGQYRIYSANPDGSDRQLVVELASSPALNQAGNQMLFYSWVSDQRGIHRIRSNGADDTYISLRAEDTLPSWSPDGTKYAYSTRAGQGGDITKRAYTIRIGSTASRPRQDPAPLIEQAQYPAWGPNGKIAFRDCGFPDDQCGIAIVNEDGSDKKVLTPNLNATAPAWSPDGSRILFMSNAAGNWDLWAISVNGGSPQRLTDDFGNDGLPVYSPDGSHIAFVAFRDNKWSVWQMDPDGENETRLFDIGGEIAGLVPGNSPAQPGQSWLEQRIAWR